MSDNTPINIPENAVDLAKELYEDSIQPTAQEVGKLVARIPAAINAALSSVDCWILAKQNNVEKVKLLLEENMKNVDPDKIIPPKPYVAVPTIQALSYSMDSDELRNLYANLLTKSIYSDTCDSVHPAYVEIIKNLSPLDCRVFNEIMGTETQEIGAYELRVGNADSNTYHVAHPYITAISLADTYAVSVSIDNLTRNKLISPEDFHYEDDTKYLAIRNSSFYQAIEKAFSDSPDGEILKPHKISIKSSRLGKSFYDVCSTAL